MSEIKENILIGKIIEHIYLSKDKLSIKFCLSTGEEIIAKCDADCCSSTWIENIEDPENIINSYVIYAEDIKLITSEMDDDCGVIRFYGFKIKTSKGECIIDYRNESNGYYGGSLVFPGDEFYGGVYGQNVSKEEWIKLI